MHSEVGVAAELVQTQSDHFSLTRFGQRQIETFEAISSQRASQTTTMKFIKAQRFKKILKRFKKNIKTIKKKLR